MTINIDDIYNRIREANNVLNGVIHRTPLNSSYTFSKLTGGDIYLKLENLQKVGAFKVRGAYYKLWKEKTKGISKCVTASSGNHAQGVAYSASQLGIKALVYMPKYTPIYKVEATKSYGAEVILYGESYDDAYQEAMKLSRERRIPFIHPFDDLDVIAGQGTIGIEVCSSLKDIDLVLVPVGGGGLISGISIALRKLSPKTKIIGVQPVGASAMYKSIKTGRLVQLDKVFTIADGVVVKKPGEITFKIIREYVDDIVTVDDGDIARAIFLLMERAKLVVEPAGALSIAAMLSNAVDVHGKRVVAIISGGNIDLFLLSEIINRGLLLENRHVRIRGVLPDKPGQLKRVVDVIAEMNLNIVSIEHERTNPLVNPGLAIVTLEIEVPNMATVKEMINKLYKKGLNFKIVPPGE